MKILKGGRLIDGTGAAAVEGATIVLRDNRIEAVMTRTQSDWPADAEIIDVSGMTVLPGLIDSHVHLLRPESTGSAKCVSTSLPISSCSTATI